ncbi:MAG TPA: hypothetical protein VGR43_08540 [Dehalococcoidia bacterium]|jgi:hypothetical protein|nr:hypothetical protein [Dehalococcoidia bacterium]
MKHEANPGVLYRAQDGTVVMRSDEEQAMALLSSAGFHSFMRNYVAGLVSQDGGVLELAHALAKSRSAGGVHSEAGKGEG